VDKRN